MAQISTHISDWKQCLVLRDGNQQQSAVNTIMPTLKPPLSAVEKINFDASHIEASGGTGIGLITKNWRETPRM